MSIEVERTEANAPINLLVNKNGGVESLTGSVKIRDGATTDYYLDFDDDTFKLTGWTEMSASLEDIGSGKYVLSGGLDISAITNLSASTHHLVAEFEITGSETGVACDLIFLRTSTYNIVDDILDEPITNHLTSGSVGDTILSGTFTPDVTISSSSIDNVVNAIWDEPVNEHLISGSTGDTLLSGTFNPEVIVASSSIDSIVDAVWDEPNSEHQISGTTGDSLLSASNPVVTASMVVDVPSLVSGVWNANNSTFNTAGSMGWIQNKMLITSESVDKVRAISCGRWIISGSQMIFFDEDNTTEVSRFNLFDTEGDPFFSEADAPAERVRTGSV